MKQISFYLILLLTGILNGYILIICAGYMHSFDITSDLITWIFPLLAEYELIYFSKLTLHAINAILLTIPAIPIFLIFGFTLTYFLRLKPLIMGWINSIGIVMVFFYSYVRYDGILVNIILASVVILVLNIFIFIKISEIYKARAND